jgi:hypothetical protein
MDEQVIDDLYNRAVSQGYKKSRQEFIGLLHSDNEVMNDMYSYVQSKGYMKDMNQFKSLVGATSPLIETPAELKKKDDTTELPSGAGSSVSSASAEPKRTQFEYQPGKPLPKQIPSVQPDQPTRPQYTEEVMFGPMGISGVKTTGEAPEFQGKSIPKVVGEIGKVLTKGAVKFPADVLETAAIATAAARNLAAKTGIVDETSALDISIPMGGANVNFFQAASEWKDLVNDFIPTDKDIESGFWGQTANALGQMVPILLTGAISGGARAIAKEAGKKGLSMQAVANYGKNVVSRIGTPQGVLTISQVAAPSYEQAKLEGATENEALGYAIQNAVMTFPLEMLPVNNLFKRLDNVLVGNTGVEVLKRAVVGGGEEFITEGVQAVYENVTADAIYGTTRSFLDGVGESAAVGGTVGAIMNGVLTALLGRRARATSAKEIEEIDKSITDVEQKIAQVDSNNESLKETVKVLEETKPRVLSYGSANYNFIESPDGALEYADDALTEQQAQGIIDNLTNSYKKIDFQIEEVEPDDPYQPTTYKIIGKPKTVQQDAVQEQAAGEVPVQSGATVSQEVAQGEPQAEPQVTAEAGVQEEVDPLRDVDSTAKALEGKNTGPLSANLLPQILGNRMTGKDANTTISEEYHKAKSDGSNPELVQAVEELLSPAVAPAPAKKGKAKAVVAPAPVVEVTSPAPVVEAVSPEPIVITDILKDIKVSFAPENAVEVQKGTREDTRGKKFTYDAAVTSQATDRNGTPIGLITKRSNEDGILSFTLKNTSGQNINKGKAYPTERDARTALAEQVNRVRAKAAAQPAPTPAPVAPVASVVAPTPEPVAAPTPEPILIDDQEEAILVTEKEIKSNLPKFTRDNAIEYDTDYKQDSMGRDVEYTSSLTVEALDIDGVEIGTITRLTDEDKINSYTAQDLDRIEVGRGKVYDSEAEVIKALTDHINKKRKKEFDKEVAKIVKARDKAAAKVKLAEEKKAAKQAAKEMAAEAEQVINSEESTLGLAERALNVLDNLDKTLDKKLKRNANDALLAIPLTTLQAAVKAVKVLIKGGIAVRDAIRRVAAENKIDENRLREALVALTKPVVSDLETEGVGVKLTGEEDVVAGENNPTVKTAKDYKDDYSAEEIFKEEHAPNSRVITTAANIASGQISYTKDGEKITFQLPYLNNNLYKRIQSLRDDYKSITGASKQAKAEKEKIKKEINKVAKKALSDFTDVMSQNLLALYDTLTPAFVKNSKEWYVGANRMANAIADKYDMNVEQVGGIIAALSPQNDWFNNVSVAERTIEIMTKYADTKLTQDIVDRAVKYNSDKNGVPNAFAEILIDLFGQIGAVSINEAQNQTDGTFIQATILRAFDQAINSPKVAITDPTGAFVGFDSTPVRWNSTSEISKAINIFRNGSVENVNENLGNGNKVRNFYNNIVDPNSSTPYVTADTHALSAALNSPISANDAGGFGLFNGSLEPTYSLVKEAYIRAAQVAGILPREMQSITWEAQRIGINDKNRTEAKKQELFDYISESRKNKETAYERATELIARNRSADPTWGKGDGIRTQKSSDQIRSEAGLRAEQRASSLSSLRGGTKRGLGAADTGVGEQAPGRKSFDQVADLDVKSKDNLAVVADFLDSIDRSIAKRLKTNANDALLAIPLTVVQGMVKGMKALVQGGMTVRDAIKKVAADNNISQDKFKDLLNLIPITQEFNALMTKADKLIARQKRNRIEPNRIVSNLDTMVRKFYEDMDVTDAQRKIMEREARARMGVEPRKAASIGRVIGVLKDIANVSREEKLKIISRIRELGRDVAKDLASEIREMAKGGTITANQSADIIARFGKVNMLNEISVSNFVDYMAKVFANAEYVSQLNTAKSARKKLRSLSKDKKKSANLRDLAAKFVEIDPTMVEDITAYNEVAKKIKESVEGSSIKGNDVKFADIVKEGTVIPYIDETLKAQNEKLYQERLKEAKDILGIDAKDLSYDELLVLLSEGKEKEKEEIRFSFENLDTNELMTSIINAFDVYSSILESSIRTGVDPFTGEQVTYNESQKKLISEFIKMDLNILSPKQALEAVDSLLNFIQNNSTAKMESILKAYQGEANVRGLVEDKVQARPLRKYWSKPLGRILGEQLTNLDLLIEKQFKGFRIGLKISNLMGLTDIKNGKSSAMSESNKIVNEYVTEFFDKKANGEVFNTDFNDVERGMAAYMMRNVIGTEAQMKAEFNRRKQLLKESIDELAQGDEREVSYSEIYQEVFDKILKDAKTIEDVTSKVDKVNLDAVKFWQSKWSDKYEELSDVSLNVYNKVLEKDIDYTPDRLARLSTDNDPVEISTDDMVFHSNNGTIYKKETGVLMDATRPKALPKNAKTGQPSRYVSLSFDKNNANAMYDALVDIKTAAPIRQAEAFINSKSFRKLVPQAEDAKILKDRIRLYVNNIRNKNPYSNDEVSKLLRGLNSIASIGVGQALGGVFQPIKQMIPVGVNTLINAKRFDFASMFNKAKQEFLNNSGYGIANRGVESQAQIESLNNLIKKASESKGEKAMRLLEEANRLQLKMFLAKPDSYIARASWITYYEKELKKLGVDPKTIDYSTHKVNKKAADYAESMVNRQQNVSDADLAGKLLGERSDEKQMFVKLLMPFASFRMNQSARVGADIGTFLSKTATKEDKAIAARSLSGFAAEMVTFRAISIGTGLVISAITSAIMGTDEEEDEKKKDSIIKGQLTSVVGDIFSPIPYTDKFIQSGVAGALDIVQDAMDIDEEDRLTLFSGKNQELLESLGLFGISAARAAQLVELIMLSTTGEYKDNFGKKKYISDDRKEALRLLIGPAILTNIGLLPVEVNSVVRSSISAAKKKSSTKEGGAAVKDYESEMIDRMEEDLLDGYENKSEMKRYNPRLYEQNFGERSEYYELTKEKREEQKKAREEEQKEKDAEYGYRGKGKGFGSRSKSSGGGFGAKKFGKD